MQLHHPRTAPVQSLRHCFQPAAGTAWEIVRVEERLQLGHAVHELSVCLPGGAAREAVVEAVADVSLPQPQTGNTLEGRGLIPG